MIERVTDTDPYGYRVIATCDTIEDFQEAADWCDVRGNRRGNYTVVCLLAGCYFYFDHPDDAVDFFFRFG